MRSRALNRLSAKFVANAPFGTFEDGGGLRLTVDARGKRFTMRITIQGKRFHKGLGSADIVSLSEVRLKAAELRLAALQGRDLAAEKRSTAFRGKTFKEVFDDYFDQVKLPTLSNGKHASQWRSTMEAYVFPALGSRQIAEINSSEVVAMLVPIWHSKPETAARVLQRVSATFQSAILHGNRERASPTIGVADYLGQNNRNIGRHAAMAYRDIPAFVRELQARVAVSSSTRLAMEFLILTAARSGEVRGAAWSEINLAAPNWMIPASRLKSRRRRKEPHIVPLGPRACAILKEARELHPNSTLIFPGAIQTRPLSENTFVKVLRSGGHLVTAHGFRSAFKDWCAEVEQVRDEVSEAALAHLISDKVRAAYLRSQFLEERKGLMRNWDRFVAGDA